MNKRIYELDTLRGVGIFLVVLGHSLTKQIQSVSLVFRVFHDAIYLMHMPIFFLVSGVLYEFSNSSKLPLKEYLVKKFKNLMIPYFCFSVLYYGLAKSVCLFTESNSLASKLNGASQSIWQVILAIAGYINHGDEHLWFLYALFWIFVITRLFFKKINIWILILIILCCNVLIFFVWPSCINKILFYLVYFSIGRFIAKNFKNFELNKLHLTINCFIIYVISFVIIFLGFIPSVNIYYILLRRVVSYANVLSAITLLFVFSKFALKKQYVFFDYLGKKSMPIYIIHQPYIVGTLTVILESINCNSIIIIFVATFLGIIVPLLFDKYFISKNKILNLLVCGK